MKNKIILLTSIFLLILISLTGCKKEEITESLTEIEPGIYIGEQNEDTNFIPKLTLNEDKSFEFNTSKTYKYDGQYHVDNNMVILTITEDKSFTFSKKDGDLKINEEIPGSINKNTKFHLWGSFKSNTIEPNDNITTEDF